MNVLLIGHAFSPGLGSEPGFTWNWALHLSRHHKVWVLAHPQFRPKVENWLKENPTPNLSCVWVDVKSSLDRWDSTKGERGIRLHYVLWLKTAYEAAAGLCRELSIDVAHHVSWGTLRAAPPLWQLPVPTVWGPLGGAQCAPLAFWRCFGSRFPQEVIRKLLTQAIPLQAGFRKAARTAAVVFATNHETERLLRNVRGAKVKLLLDCGLPQDWIPKAPPAKRVTEEFTLFWAGRLEHRKALAIGLRALQLLQVPVRLLVAGTGELEQELQLLAAELGLAERVTFLGSVKYSEMPALFQKCDAFLFTSLRDSFGSVVLEAMAQGLPIIALDHQGVGTFVAKDAAIKVPVVAPKETIRLLADAITKLATSPGLRDNMGRAAWEFACRQSWERRAELMSEIYKGVAAGGLASILSKNTDTELFMGTKG